MRLLQGTSYGAGQDSQGTCSYGSNMANTNDLPWKSGLSMTVAMNDDQFGSSVACGMCITFQGTGSGIGTMPIPGRLSPQLHSCGTTHFKVCLCGLLCCKHKVEASSCRCLKHASACTSAQLLQAQVCLCVDRHFAVQ